MSMKIIKVFAYRRDHEERGRHSVFSVGSLINY